MKTFLQWVEAKIPSEEEILRNLGYSSEEISKMDSFQRMTAKMQGAKKREKEEKEELEPKIRKLGFTVNTEHLSEGGFNTIEQAINFARKKGITLQELLSQREKMLQKMNEEIPIISDVANKIENKYPHINFLLNNINKISLNYTADTHRQIMPHKNPVEYFWINFLTGLSNKYITYDEAKDLISNYLDKIRVFDEDLFDNMKKHIFSNGKYRIPGIHDRWNERN